MMVDIAKINQLEEFIAKDKFSKAVWKERYLNPSDEILCKKMNDLLNDSAEKVIRLLENDASKSDLKKQLKIGLKNFKKYEYDTEERELICDYYYELSKIVYVDLEKELNVWMYGRLLPIIMRFLEK